jgi:hypothetical protein
LVFAVVGLAIGAGNAPAEYRSAVLADNPDSYFRMDDGDETLRNETANGNGEHVANPTRHSPGALVNAQPNFAVAYASNATDRSRFQVSDTGSYTAFSLEFFVNTALTFPDAGPQWYNGRGLVDGEVSGVTNDAGTALMPDGRVGFGMGNPDVTIRSASVITDREWHHIVATSNGSGRMRLYVDGALQNEITNGPTGARSNANFTIGDLDTLVGPFAGTIDEVAFYRQELTPVDVSDHYAARNDGPRMVTVLTNVFGGGEGTVSGSDGMHCPPTCSVDSPAGTVNYYETFAPAGSRFGGFIPNADGVLDCAPYSDGLCQVDVDDVDGLEFINAYFFLSPESLANELNRANESVGKLLEKALDGSVNPGKARDIKYPDVPLQVYGDQVGIGAGELVTLISKSKVDLIGSDGASLVGNAGNTLTTKGIAALISDNGSGLISDNGSSILSDAAGGLIGDHGGGLLGSDGATLIGDAGSGLISDNGSGRPQDGRAAKPKPKPKYKAFALGGYRTELTDTGAVQVTFEISDDGRKIIKTMGKQNLALGKNQTIPLNASLIQLVQPADHRGTGGSFEEIKFK